MAWSIETLNKDLPLFKLPHTWAFKVWFSQPDLHCSLIIYRYSQNNRFEKRMIFIQELRWFDLCSQMITIYWNYEDCDTVDFYIFVSTIKYVAFFTVKTVKGQKDSEISFNIDMKQTYWPRLIGPKFIAPHFDSLFCFFKSDVWKGFKVNDWLSMIFS